MSVGSWGSQENTLLLFRLRMLTLSRDCKGGIITQCSNWDGPFQHIPPNIYPQLYSVLLHRTQSISKHHAFLSDPVPTPTYINLTQIVQHYPHATCSLICLAPVPYTASYTKATQRFVKLPAASLAFPRVKSQIVPPVNIPIPTKTWVVNSPTRKFYRWF